MLDAAVLGGRRRADVARLSSVGAASAAVDALVLVDEGADLVLADAALPEAHSVRVRGDEEALAREAAALQTVLKTKRWDSLDCSVDDTWLFLHEVCILGKLLI